MEEARSRRRPRSKCGIADCQDSGLRPRTRAHHQLLHHRCITTPSALRWPWGRGTTAMTGGPGSGSGRCGFACLLQCHWLFYGFKIALAAPPSPRARLCVHEQHNTHLHKLLSQSSRTCKYLRHIGLMPYDRGRGISSLTRSFWRRALVLVDVFESGDGDRWSPFDDGNGRRHLARQIGEVSPASTSS